MNFRRYVQLIVSFTLCLSFQHYAQAEVAESKLVSVASGLPHDFIYSISFSANKGVAVGSNGLILNSTDGGLSWSKIGKQVTQDALLSISNQNGKCLASGQSGVVVWSDDCTNWKAVKPITEARLLSIAANTNGMAYAVGGFGTILASSDGGETWAKIAVPWGSILSTGAEPHLYSVLVDDAGVVTVAGEFELIIRSSDKGKTWKTLHKGTRSIFDLYALRDGKIYAVGQEGLILSSGNNGELWSEVKSKTNALLTGVWASPDGKSVAIAGVRTLLKSSDGGRSFSMDSSGVLRGAVYTAITGFVDSKNRKNIFIGGTAGKIFHEIN